MANIELRYRRKQIRSRIRYEAQVRKAFIRVANEFAKKFGNSPLIRHTEAFEFSSNKKLIVELTEMMSSFHSELYGVVSGGIADSWKIANDMNDDVVNYYFAGLSGFKGLKESMMSRNGEALAAFAKRKMNSRTLSDNIWKATNKLRDELEANLMIGIADGKSAADVAVEIKKFLVEPGNIYRRVRSEDGELVLSKAAKKLKLKKGQYRSSYKNALRVARTEINSAYRTADNLRWQTQDFVIGYDVSLSEQHPRIDICDELEGRYPKEFVYDGWHPHCFCHAVPVRMPREDFVRKLKGEPVKINYVTELPTEMKSWIGSNQSVFKLKNKPYWVINNKSMLRKI